MGDSETRNKIVVTLPAYNEAGQIGEVLKRIKKVLPQAALLVIDDGSKDSTAEKAKAAGAQVISFAANRGIVEAFKTGLKNALLLGADIIVTMDADGQHLPEEIPALLEPIEKKKADMVIGSRFLGKIRSKSRTKYLGNIAFSRLISRLVGNKITDAQSGFRAYTREVAERLNIHKGYTYTQQMSIFAIYYPLKFFGTSGILIMILGTWIGLSFPANDNLSAMLVLIGVQMILFGILFELINKK
ncbi:glycosyltransferase family 2 protein [Candidatus Woesearchaeota archaeon]|nr:glycosyltransferase family 2 protein [Candidatus Woesearchaeota archaeon]